MRYFITAIHTDSGKTLVSAIVTHALQADYWKPIQCGSPKDKDTVASLLQSRHSIIFDESYFLKEPASPHAAAALENIRIDLKNVHLPENGGNTLVIEGAGGIMVPLNEKDFVIDIAEKFNAEVILVSNIYLGSINHTVLTINELKRRNVKVKGVIFNGSENKATEEYILNYSGYRCLLKIRPEPEINAGVVNKYALKLVENWDE
ncbi:MAG: dethiobiotin synthase [Cytophagaceae bacterium]